MIGKKGSSKDLFFILTGFFMVCVVGILVSSVVTRFNTELQKVNVIPAEAKSSGTTLAGVMPNTLNAGMLFLFFGACFIALILASMTPTSPIFFVFFIFELVILIFFGAGIADAFQVFIETPALATEHGQYSMIIFLFRYLPYIIGVIGFILAAVMYKVSGDQ